jgi:raffinose/stachyose/melibiose transport system substrate-binding protein
MTRTFTRLGGLMAIATLIFSACSGAATSPSGAATGESPASPAATGAAGEPVTLSFWYWAESDAPGADAWMTESVKAYQTAHPNITINVVPQSTDTLQSAFQTAAASNSGPDIASQWATGPVLGFVWSDAVAPISDLVPADEMAHWLNTNENTYAGKVWAMPMYLLGIGLGYNKDLFTQAGVTPPSGDRWTWDEFLAASAKLKAAGITPFVGGDKNGYLGAWWFANVGGQQLDSTNDLVKAVIGDVPFTDAKYTGWYTELEKYVKAGNVNNDVMSLDLDQGVRLLSQGKGAMAFGTDGMIAQWIKDLGADKVGVMRPPKWGTGQLADAGNATQSISFFVTKWSQHQQEAADFLQYLHTADRLTAWYKATGVVAADDRFDSSLVTTPQLQTMAKFETTGTQVWLENWIPTQLDGDGDIPAGQMIFSGSGSAADAAQLWERVAQTWRNAHPDELANWQQLAK